MMQQRILTSVAAIAWTLVLPSTLLAQQDRPAVQLPDGDAKAVIEGTCAACHRLDFITDSRGYTQEDWSELISSMITLPRETADSVVGYLAEHFPKQPGTDPVLISGPVEVSISEWLAPKSFLPPERLVLPVDRLYEGPMSMVVVICMPAS